MGKESNMKTIHNPPDWSNMFNIAIKIVETSLRQNNQVPFVVEMLKYGQRMHNNDIECSECGHNQIDKLLAKKQNN